MKIVRFELNGKSRWGVLTEPTRVSPLSERHNGESMLEFEQSDSLLADMEGRTIDTSRLDWLPPTVDRPKIICIGKNYADHAKEMGGDAPELPVVFSKFASALIPHQGKIVLPAISQQVDFESELVVVIGRPGRHIQQAVALRHVAGFTCGNDVSARDWQKGRPGGQWLLGKTFDTFAPLGPVLVTADEVGDPHKLEICLRLNGQVMQQANTSSLLYRIDYLIAHISQFFTLEPGDLIFTGTPAGVGAGRTPPVFLKPDDDIEIEISKIGKLRNSVVAE
jgi:2-keto-4-pentenoate hydratase/2-oxohepta-3-ene-1,7-dioic acid hydratase in catechol pathway